MAIYAKERSFLLKNIVFWIFGHFEFEYQKAVQNLICKLSLLMSKKNFVSQKFELWHDANKYIFFVSD